MEQDVWTSTLVLGWLASFYVFSEDYDLELEVSQIGRCVIKTFFLPYKLLPYACMW